MTTEDNFHAALDANPEDWQTRLVFADWLEEHASEVPCPKCEGRGAVVAGEYFEDHACCPQCAGTGRVSDGHAERAEGYRALGVLQKRPKRSSRGTWYWYTSRPERPDLPTHPQHYGANLPNDWWDTVLPAGQAAFPTRREAEDAAALAFAKLPAARRAELLSVEVTA